jgi:hypothetical protein
MSGFRGTHDHIVVCQIRDFPKLEGQVPVFISPRNKGIQLYPRHWGSLFVASYDTQGYGGGIRPLLHKGSASNHSPVLAAGPRYIDSTRTAQKTFLPTVIQLLRVTQPLPSNDYFSGSIILVSKYATILSPFTEFNLHRSQKKTSNF